MGEDEERRDIKVPVKMTASEVAELDGYAKSVGMTRSAAVRWALRLAISDRRAA